MRRVCLIEPESHYEVVRNFVLSLIDETEFTVITNSYCEGNLGVILSNNVRIINYETEEDIVFEILSEDRFDYKLTTTPPSYSFYKKHKIWFRNSELLIHNMNYWLQPFKSVYFLKNPSLSSIMSLLRFLKYLPRLVFRRKRYAEVFSHYIAPSEALYEHYRAFEKMKGFVRLDFQFFTSEVTLKPKMDIVIPGTVNSFRDYDLILQILREVSTERKVPCRVVILGVNLAKKKFQEYACAYLDVKTFTESLTDYEYTKELRSADFGILPLREDVDYMGILERKGISNISGGVNDLIYVGIRGLIPSFYGTFRQDSLEAYSSPSDLRNLVGRFFDDHAMTKTTQRSLIQNKEVMTSNLKVIRND